MNEMNEEIIELRGIVQTMWETMQEQKEKDRRRKRSHKYLVEQVLSDHKTLKKLETWFDDFYEDIRKRSKMENHHHRKPKDETESADMADVESHPGPAHLSRSLDTETIITAEHGPIHILYLTFLGLFEAIDGGDLSLAHINKIARKFRRTERATAEVGYGLWYYVDEYPVACQGYHFTVDHLVDFTSFMSGSVHISTYEQLYDFCVKLALLQIWSPFGDNRDGWWMADDAIFERASAFNDATEFLVDVFHQHLHYGNLPPVHDLEVDMLIFNSDDLMRAYNRAHLLWFLGIITKNGYEGWRLLEFIDSAPVRDLRNSEGRVYDRDFSEHKRRYKQVEEMLGGRRFMGDYDTKVMMLALFHSGSPFDALPRDVKDHISKIVRTPPLYCTPRLVVPPKEHADPTDETESADMADIESHPGPQPIMPGVTTIVDRRAYHGMPSLSVNPMANHSQASAAAVVDKTVEMDISMEGNRVDDRIVRQLIKSIAIASQRCGYHSDYAKAADRWYKQQVELVMPFWQLLFAACEGDPWRRWILESGNFMLFCAPNLRGFRIAVGHEEHYAICNQSWIDVAVQVKVADGGDHLVLPVGQRNVLRSPPGSGKTQMLISVLVYFSNVPAGHPNRIGSGTINDPGSPAVLVVPSQTLAAQVFQDLRARGCRVVHYLETTGRRWYNEGVMLVCCINSVLHKVDENRRHSFVFLSEMETIAELIVANGQFMATRDAQTQRALLGATASNKASHLMQVAQNADVLVVESAFMDGVGFLFALEAAHKDRTKVMVRFNLPNTRTKKQYVWYAHMDSFFQSLFARIVAAPNKKVFITCDQRSTVVKLEQILLRFYAKLLGPEEDGADGFFRVETLHSESPVSQRNKFMQDALFGRMCHHLSRTRVLIVSPSVLAGVSLTSTDSFGTQAAVIGGYGRNAPSALGCVQQQLRIRKQIGDAVFVLFTQGLGNVSDVVYDRMLIHMRDDPVSVETATAFGMSQRDCRVRPPELEGAVVSHLSEFLGQLQHFVATHQIAVPPEPYWTTTMTGALMFTTWIHAQLMNVMSTRSTSNARFVRQLYDAMRSIGARIAFDVGDRTVPAYLKQDVEKAVRDMRGNKDHCAVVDPTADDPDAKRCREFAVDIGLDPNDPDFERRLFDFKLAFKCKDWPVRFKDRLCALVRRTYDTGPSTEDAVEGMRIETVRRTIDAIAETIVVAGYEHLADVERRVWDPLTWFAYPLILAHSQEEFLLRTPLSDFTTHDALRLLWPQLETSPVVAYGKEPERETLKYGLLVLREILDAEFGLLLKYKKLRPVRIVYDNGTDEMYDDRTQWNLDFEQMAWVWSIVPDPLGTHRMLRQNGVTAHKITSEDTAASSNLYMTEQNLPIWFTVVDRPNRRGGGTICRRDLWNLAKVSWGPIDIVTPPPRTPKRRRTWPPAEAAASSSSMDFNIDTSSLPDLGSPGSAVVDDWIQGFMEE